MTMVLSTPQLAPEDLREVVEIVLAGLGAGHWTPRVYDALADWCDHVKQCLSDGEPAPDLPTPVPPAARRPPPATPAKRPRGSSRPPRVERPGELHCPNHDGGAGKWLPVSAFRPRRDRPGKYQSWCRECNQTYAARKYLSAATVAALTGEGLVVATLPAGSPLLANPCPRCTETWRATDRIVAGGIVVFHKECLSTEEDHEHQGD